MAYGDSPFVDTEVSVPAYVAGKANLYPPAFFKFKPCDPVETERLHTTYLRLAKQDDPTELFAFLAKTNKERVASIVFSPDGALRSLSLSEWSKMKRNLQIDVFLVACSIVGSDAIPEAYKAFCDVEPSVEKLEKK